jgi:hypothetical protein
MARIYKTGTLNMLLVIEQYAMGGGQVASSCSLSQHIQITP